MTFNVGDLVRRIPIPPSVGKIIRVTGGVPIAQWPSGVETCLIIQDGYEKVDPNPIRVEQEEPIPAGSNPFHYDPDRMGIPIDGSVPDGNGGWKVKDTWMVMWCGRAETLVIVHRETGKRVILHAPESA